MNSILNQIAEHKILEVQKAKNTLAQDEMDFPQDTRRNFVSALKKHSPAIIAEVKQASPSKGIICKNFDVPKIVEEYTHNGASCLSILTDSKYFKGSSKNLNIARTHSHLPLLRKDFIIDPYQIFESLYLNADCILLIVALLDKVELHDFCQIANELNLSVLVESHTLQELEIALDLPTPLMGINNRNLHTFETDLQLSIELKKYIPSDKILITESGISTHADIVKMQTYGINTFLVGESLMLKENIGYALHALIHGNNSSKL